MVGGVTTNNGKNWLLNRAYKATTDYEEVYYIKLGIGLTTPLVTDTDVEIPIPISNGTVNDDGSNVLTGSSGGTDSTDNIAIFKEGAGVVDVTAQNLIGNDTSVTKIWTISNLATLGTIITSSEHVSLWTYIKDTTTLNKLKSTGTCLEIKLGSDINNYYSITKESSDLLVGWNWITSNTDTVADLSETGTVTGDIDTFIIEITTNNATDEFVAGDIIYDLLRSYDDDDLFKVFVTGYPTIDEINIRSNIRCYLTTIEATGFNITEFGTFNNDATPVLLTHDVIDSISKSSTDEVAFISKDQMREHL